MESRDVRTADFDNSTSRLICYRIDSCLGLICGGLCQFWPYFKPILGVKIFSRNDTAGFPLNRHAYPGGKRRSAIHHILQMAFGCAALFCKRAPLKHRHFGDEFFKVHPKIKPFGFLQVNTI